MNTKYILKSVKLMALASLLACGANLRATMSPTAQTLGVSAAGQNEFQPMAFSDSTEAGMLHRAYRILATGDHDYRGHRVKAMHQIEAAAKLLGLDLAGDLKDRQPQLLSDDKMREASGLISNVLNSAVVKDQKRIVKHLTEAVNQINAALTIK
jgi:hypothetical protein